MKKVILVTGASSGIGLACATALQSKGHTVYGSARNLNRLQSPSFKPIQLDVTDNSSVSNAIATIIQAEGKLDVLVRCQHVLLGKCKAKLFLQIPSLR